MQVDAQDTKLSHDLVISGVMPYFRFKQEVFFTHAWSLLTSLNYESVRKCNVSVKRETNKSQGDKFSRLILLCLSCNFITNEFYSFIFFGL